MQSSLNSTNTLDYPSRRQRLRFIAALLRPHGPDDPRQFVGDRDGGNIRTTALDGVDGKSLQRGRLRFRLRVPQDGSRAVDQEHPKVDVALFTNRAEAAAQRGRVLFGRKAQKTGEVTPGSESSNITHQGHQRGRR